MEALVLINGRSEQRVSWADRGFQYGDGVFTTLPVRGGHPALLARHIARLARDCDRLSLPFDCAAAVIEEAGRLGRSGSDGILKIQITRGSGGRGYRMPERPAPTRVLALHPPAGYDASIQTRGVRVRICRHRLGWNPALAGIKHTNRLEQILARSEWDDEDVEEGLMLDQGGFLIEGTMSNLFIVQEGRLVTPRIDRCGVAGVMRELVLEIAARLGIPAEQRRLRPADLDRADEVFLTNSVIGLWPVRRVQQRAFSVGSLSQRLASLVADEVGREA